MKCLTHASVQPYLYSRKTSCALNLCGPYLLRAVLAPYSFVRRRWVQRAEHFNAFDSRSINMGQWNHIRAKHPATNNTERLCQYGFPAAERHHWLPNSTGFPVSAEIRGSRSQLMNSPRPARDFPRRWQELLLRRCLSKVFTRATNVFGQYCAWEPISVLLHRDSVLFQEIQIQVGN